MNQITEHIWLGNSQDARNVDALRASGITSILNCAEDLPPALGWKEGITHFHVGLRDDSNHSSRYRAACCVLEALVDEGKSVLVHCHEGRSRSPYVVALYLAPLKFDWQMERAIAFIKERRPIVEIHQGHLNHA